MTENIYNIMPVEGLINHVIQLAMKVHSNLHNGYVEEVYKKALCIELRKANIPHAKEQKIEVFYEGELVGFYKADIIVCNRLILELKSVEYLTKDFSVQLVNYLKTTGINDGLLINFGNFDGLIWFHKTREYNKFVDFR